MNTLKTLAVGLLVMLASAHVHAQETGAQTPVEMRKASDAAIDRNILLPSAETISAGDLTFNDYELVLAGFSYGITDDMQLSLTTLLPITTDIPFVLLGSFKWRLVTTGNLVFSTQPAVGFITQSGDSVGSISLGFLLDLVLDPEGKFVLSFSEITYWGFGSMSDESFDMADNVAFALSAGANFRVHQYVKLLTEFIITGGVIDGEFHLFDEVVFFNYGVRFCSQTISVDLTFLRPIVEGVSDSLVMGIPYVTFSARF
jgi:hypothetical protein